MNVIYNNVRTLAISLYIFLLLIILYLVLWICLPPYLLTQINNYIGINKITMLSLLLVLLFLVFISNNKILILGKQMFVIIISMIVYYSIYSIIQGAIAIPPVFEFVTTLINGTIIYLFLTNFLLTKYNIKLSNYIQTMIIVSTIISSIVGIYQMLTNVGGGIPELPGLFYVKNHFGIFVSIGFALSATRLFLERNIKKVIWLIISLILLISVVISMSRAAWLSSILILFVLAIYFNKKYLLTLPTILMIVILLIFWERIFDVAYLGDISTGRFLLWATFFSHFINYGNLVFGLGVGYTFQFNPKELVGFVGFQAADNPYIYVHNDFFYFLLETGIIGLILFIIFYIIVFRDLNRFLKSKNNFDDTKIILAVKCSLIPIIVMHLTDTFLFASGLLYYLFFILSTAYRIIEKYKVNENEKV